MSETTEPRIWHCPLCKGHGTLADAVIEVGRDGVKVHKPASQCWLCRGKGVVLVQPLPEGYAKEQNER